MSKSQASWDKLLALIEKAKLDDDLSDSLRHGTPSQVATILDGEGLSMIDLGLIFDDLGVIADRNSLQWWSPLA
jgi:hypothetical protein